MRRFSLLLLVLLALAFASSAVAAPVFVVNGRGWGHGIGLSQYGARGFAEAEKRTYDWILAHYYRGTTLESAPPTTVRVLLAEGRRSVDVGSDAPFKLVDATGQAYDLPAGKRRLRPALKVKVNGKVKTLASPVTVVNGGKFVELGGNAYRGSLVVTSSGSALSVVNHIGLEQYLYGVVAGEMPASWPAEALKAQAVAARSYALATLKRGGAFDLYSDTRSQVYRGVAGEDARTNAAVDATATQAVFYGDAVATTFFHSTSGGRTAAVRDVWPGARDVPYLVSVPDPHDSISPYHRWGPLLFSARDVQSRLGGAALGRVRDVTVTPNASERAASVAVTGSRGTVTVDGATFRTLFDLRSSWFAVGVLSLESESRRVVIGSKVVLTGIARGVSAAWLEERRPGGAWQRLVPVPVGAGAFQIPVQPGGTTSYRLVSPEAVAPVWRVLVEPRVTLRARGGNALVGRVSPAVAGAAVALQRHEGTRWRTLARTETDARGRFRVELALAPGTYRAVARVGAGFVPGKSASLSVAG